MRKLILLLIILLFFSCNKKIENPYFTSDKIYNTVLNSLDSINKNISKTDKHEYLYIFNRYDTLIVTSTEFEPYDGSRIKKIDTFSYEGKKVTITKPYKPVFKILKNEIPINEKNKLPLRYCGNDYPKGYIYKIKDLNHLELIDKGDLRKYFYPIKEYEIPPPPPPPKEYLEKKR